MIYEAGICFSLALRKMSNFMEFLEPWYLTIPDESQIKTRRVGKRGVLESVMFLTPVTRRVMTSCPGYVNRSVSKNFKGLILNGTDIFCRKMNVFCVPLSLHITWKPQTLVLFCPFRILWLKRRGEHMADCSVVHL